MSGESSLDDEPDAIERWVLPYFRDSSLWPVLLVVLGALIGFVGIAVLFAVRDHKPLGIVSTGLLIIASLRAIRWEWRLHGRAGPISVALGLVWFLASAAAWFGARSGLL